MAYLYNDLYTQHVNLPHTWRGASAMVALFLYEYYPSPR